jgi:hypothetical protein
VATTTSDSRSRGINSIASLQALASLRIASFDNDELLALLRGTQPFILLGVGRSNTKFWQDAKAETSTSVKGQISDT